MTRWAVSVNVGGGPGCSAARIEGMTRWAAAAAGEYEPAIVFAQEVPDARWLEVWKGRGYTLFLGEDRGWKIRSALLTAPGLDVEPVTAAHVPNLRYHGSYLAAARWLNAPAAAGTCLVSVHASPQPAEPDRYGWQGRRPTPRHGGGDPRYPPARLWDSDLVLATLHDLADQGRVPVLAAGDYNEALAHDLDPHTGKRLGSWGQEYLARAEQYGLQDWLGDVWGEERGTRAGLQLDRVLISGPARPLLRRTPSPFVDPAWPGTGSSSFGLSDHAPVWFALAG